ncbi:MAG: hypothetical protein AB7U63_06210 [Porticoccaceae bacterium]
MATLSANSIQATVFYPSMLLYIIQKPSGEVLDRHLNWISADEDSALLFRTPHKDVALNQLIELTARDIHLRARVVACNSNDRDNPVVEPQPDTTAG